MKKRLIGILMTIIGLLVVMPTVLSTSCIYAWDCPEKAGYSRICSNYVNGVGECSYYDDDAGCFAIGYWVDSCDECCYYCCDNHECVIGASECGECGDVGDSCTYDYDCCGDLYCRDDRTCRERYDECNDNTDCWNQGNLGCWSDHLRQTYCDEDGRCWNSRLEYCGSDKNCNPDTLKCEIIDECLEDGAMTTDLMTKCCSGKSSTYVDEYGTTWKVCGEGPFCSCVSGVCNNNCGAYAGKSCSRLTDCADIDCGSYTNENTCKERGCVWWTAYQKEPECVDCVPDGQRIGGSVCEFPPCLPIIGCIGTPTCSVNPCDCSACCSGKVHDEIFAGSSYYYCGESSNGDIVCSDMDETECPGKTKCCWDPSTDKCWDKSKIPSEYTLFEKTNFCFERTSGYGAGRDLIDQLVDIIRGGSGGGSGGGGIPGSVDNCSYQTSWIPSWVPYVGSKTIQVVEMCEAETPCLKKLGWTDVLHPLSIPKKLLTSLFTTIGSRLGFVDPCAMCEERYVECKIIEMCKGKEGFELTICKIQAWLEGIKINKGEMYYYGIIIGIPLVLILIFKPNVIKLGGKKK